MTQSLGASFSAFTPDLYVGKHCDDLYFAMERLTDANFGKWKAFHSEEEMGALNLHIEGHHNLGMRLQGGLEGFSDALTSYELKRETSPHEVWALYASVVPITGMSPRSNNNIEMACTVSTSPDFPFTTHMGILRTHRSAMEMITQHKNISIKLHSFGAKVMRSLYPDKIYVITTPMPVMENIFKERVGQQNVFGGLYEDWNKEVKDYTARIEKLSNDSDSELLELLVETRAKYAENIAACGPNPRIIIGPSLSTFHLKDLENNTILDVKVDRATHWYFSRKTTFFGSNIVALPIEVLANYSDLDI